MAKIFNVTADCKPDKHYMVKLDTRLAAIKAMVDEGAYFTINRARQYGKTTTLRALNKYLQGHYYVSLMDFQTFGAGEFVDENTFSLAFGETFLWTIEKYRASFCEELEEAVKILEKNVEAAQSSFRLRRLFANLRDIFGVSDKPFVLLIDEVDSASNNQVFLDFLAQLRAGYINRDEQPAFQSVVLTGVHDVKNLQKKIRPESESKINSPWNIAAEFKVEMSFEPDEIARMLQDYEADHRTGMDIEEMAKLIYDYTSGYPFLVSRVCKLMDEDISVREEFGTKSAAWTRKGLNEAVKYLLSEKNTLFESLSGKLVNYPELSQMLREVLFGGKKVAYNSDSIVINNAAMFGFVRNKDGAMVVANRIFETRLYNYFLSETEIKGNDIYVASLRDRNQFVVDGHLNMRRVLERFVVHFNDLYGRMDESFIEEEGRKYFLLYLRPIINGTGNYYIEARTRDLRRTDVIVDYHGEQFVIELKIWHGNEYNARGEAQLIGYLEDYHQDKGYMVSFNFNKNKQIGVQEIVIGNKVLIEAVV